MKTPYKPITLEDLNLTEEDTELLISGAKHLFKEDIGDEVELATTSPFPGFYPPVKPSKITVEEAREQTRRNRANWKSPIPYHLRAERDGDASSNEDGVVHDSV